MKIIVPMAGTGNRFVQAGYTDPKPLIKVMGKRVIEYILDAFLTRMNLFSFAMKSICKKQTWKKFYLS